MEGVEQGHLRIRNRYKDLTNLIVQFIKEKQKMQYVDQEQATLTLHDVSIPFLEKNWDGLFKEIQAMNIKLIYIDNKSF